MLLHKRLNGVTQVKFSPNGRYLYVASRKHNHIHCYDIRNAEQEIGTIAHSYARSHKTNQRIGFDIDAAGKYLASGDTNGNVNIYDLNTDLKELMAQEKEGQNTNLGFKAHEGNKVNGQNNIWIFGQQTKYLHQDHCFSFLRLFSSSNHHPSSHVIAATYCLPKDTVSGCSFNPATTLLATCSGSKHYVTDLSISDDECANVPASDCSVKFWQTAARWA